MGIVETIMEFFGQKDKGPSPKEFIRQMEQAGEASDYKQASKQAFKALEIFGQVYGGIKREGYVTAREYSKLLVETGSITKEELHPIIYNFEVATYSEGDVTFEDYQTLKEAVDNANSRLKQIGKATDGKTSSRTGAARRRAGGKQTRRKATGRGAGTSTAARRRKARTRKK